jgi:hypothetical protein
LLCCGEGLGMQGDRARVRGCEGPTKVAGPQRPQPPQPCYGSALCSSPAAQQPQQPSSPSKPAAPQRSPLPAAAPAAAPPVAVPAAAPAAGGPGAVVEGPGCRALQGAACQGARRCVLACYHGPLPALQQAAPLCGAGVGRLTRLPRRPQPAHLLRLLLLRRPPREGLLLPLRPRLRAASRSLSRSRSLARRSESLSDLSGLRAGGAPQRACLETGRTQAR